MWTRCRILFCAAALSVGAARSSFAADGNAKTLDISIKSRQCREISEVWVVMDGDDRRPNPTDPKPNCHWLMDLNETFRTNQIHFSLRYSGLGRTGCRKSKWDGKLASHINFDYVPAHVRLLTLKQDPDSTIVYVREVGTKGRDDEPCKEDGKLSEQDRDITEVDASWEKVRLLRIAGEKDLCGLLVTSLGELEKAAARKGVPVELKKGALVLALQQQNDGLNKCQPASLGSGAADVSQKMLDQRPLNSLSLTVR